MSKKIDNIKERITGKEFKQFFRKELLSNLKVLEKDRKRSIVKIIFFLFIALIIFSVFLWFKLIVKIEVEKQIFDIYACITFIPVAIAYYIYYLYRQKAKSLILEKLLNFIGDFKIEENKNDRNYIENLKLFDRFNRFSCDDRLKGTYNLLPIDIQEISLKLEKYIGKRKHTYTIFNGIFIKAPCYKKFSGYTLIKRKSFILEQPINIFAGKSKILLEDPIFNEHYDVYSDDQVESRYLITAAFMERMINLAKHSLNDNISISFEHGNVNIAVESNQNWFEVPILKPATDINNYKYIIFELITILKIIDSLKLDQNIGL